MGRLADWSPGPDRVPSRSPGWAGWVPRVGDLVFPPERFESLPNYAEIWSGPGCVVSVVDGWAVVDRGRWGQFGMPAGELRPAGRECVMDDWTDGRARAARRHTAVYRFVGAALEDRREPREDWRAAVGDAVAVLDELAQRANHPDDVDRVQEALRHLAGIWLSVDEVEELAEGTS